MLRAATAASRSIDARTKPVIASAAPPRITNVATDADATPTR